MRDSLLDQTDLKPLTKDEAKDIISKLETAYGWTGELPELDRTLFYRMARTLEIGVRYAEEIRA